MESRVEKNNSLQTIKGEPISVVKDKDLKPSIKDESTSIVEDKHLKPVLEVLDKKNIKGIRLIKQDSRIILLMDKQKLSNTNREILNRMSVTYPNFIVGINDANNPFDYGELYEEKGKERVNRKVRPFDVHEFVEIQKKQPYQYYEQYQFAGIELESSKLNSTMQLGYFLEFVNAMQEQNPLEMEGVEIKKGIECYTSEQLRRYEHYMENGQPDTKKIRLLVGYNEEIEEFTTGIELKHDPYFYRLQEGEINKKNLATDVKFIEVNLMPKKLLDNVYQYVEDKKREVDNTTKISQKQKGISDKKTLVNEGILIGD